MLKLKSQLNFEKLLLILIFFVLLYINLTINRSLTFLFFLIQKNLYIYFYYTILFFGLFIKK